MANFNIFLWQKNIAGAVLVILIANLIIGGVLLPYRSAKAIPCAVVADPYTWAETVYDLLKWAWERVSAAYRAAAAWISANWAVWNRMDTWYMRALRAAWFALRRQLLNMLVNDIIQWINGGGRPKVVTDWQGFLRNAADRAAGQFIDRYLGLGFLCDTFRLQLNIALAQVQTFDEAVRCPVSMMWGNISNFFTDFSQGSWRRWIQVSQPQNNIYGAYLLMMDKKIGMEGEAREASKNEGIASSGFLGERRCAQIYENGNPSNTGDFRSAPLRENEVPTGWTCGEWTIVTPGKIAAEAVVKAANLDIDWLISAKEFEEYGAAIINAVINRMIREGVTYLTTPSGGSSGQSGPGIDRPPSVTVDLTAYEDAARNQGNVAAILDQERLLRDNLTSYQGELQTNLGVLNQVRNAQLGSLDILRQMIASSCPLPGGATQTALSSQISDNCATTCPCDRITTEDIRITVPGSGEMVVRRTTTQRISESNPTEPSQCLVFYPPLAFSCNWPTTCSTTQTSQAVSSQVAIDAEITNVNNEIDSNQRQINNVIDPAIIDMGAYNQSIVNYMTTYENVQRSGTTTQADLQAAEQAMRTAKSQAIASTQAVTGSSSAEPQVLLQEVQQRSMQLVQQSGDAQMRRGAIQSCDFAQGGTYYRDLCDAQANQRNYQNAYGACLTAQAGGGGGGGGG